ncbi:arylesterase [Lysobacter sp. A6]|uniref:Arylesterase n=1 Tax=Noviluteimonas lactosilytica TaxID=2888523 RepID=A0ABS8JF43_9GAMM|nr:arylesterase [Lysobacter lactosilyticus]MCC8362217.1 arylesterase [Lysobacter lactosilyticus]
MNQWVIGRGRVFARVFATLLLCLAVLAPAVAATPAKTSAKETPRTVLVMGDSLSAAYGLSASQGWVALTAARIAKDAPAWRVVNASISGETTAGGAARIDGELKRVKPKLVVIALGANDGLRGLPMQQAKANLDRMIRNSQAAGAKVMLIGMQIPPNYGREYTQAFEGNFAALAKQYKLAYVPFLLEPIARDRANFQDDNLHPVAAAQPKIRDHVWKTLGPLLK